MSLWFDMAAVQMSTDGPRKIDAEYGNPAYDALYEQSTTQMDPQKRQQLFLQMNDILINDFSVIPLVHWADTSGIANDIGGYDPTSWDSETWNIADWYRKQ